VSAAVLAPSARKRRVEESEQKFSEEGRLPPFLKRGKVNN